MKCAVFALISRTKDVNFSKTAKETVKIIVFFKRRLLNRNLKIKPAATPCFFTFAEKSF